MKEGTELFFLPLVPGFVRRHLLNSCYLRCNVPREHSRRCGWHPANSVESCNGAAALQQLWLWSHKSALIQGRARSESKRHAPPQKECHSVYIISSFIKPPVPLFSKCFSVDQLFFFWLCFNIVCIQIMKKLFVCFYACNAYFSPFF